MEPKNHEKSLVVATLVIFVVFGMAFRVHATEFNSPNFKILDPVIGIFSSRATSSNFIQLESGGQPAIGLSASSNFIVRSGFLYFPGPPSPAPSPGISPSPPPPGTGLGLGGGILFPPTPTPRITLLPTPRLTPPPFLAIADLNADGRINLIDASILFYWWAKPVTPYALAAISKTSFDFASPDINNDTKVDIIDLSILLYYWTG